MSTTDKAQELVSVRPSTDQSSPIATERARAMMKEHLDAALDAFVQYMHGKGWRIFRDARTEGPCALARDCVVLTHEEHPGIRVYTTQSMVSPVTVVWISDGDGVIRTPRVWDGGISAFYNSLVEGITFVRQVLGRLEPSTKEGNNP